MKKPKTILLFLFSLGWLVPLYFSFYFHFTWLNTEVAPVVYANTRQGNSFPFLHESQKLWTISFFWMCAVILYWFISILIIVNTISEKAKTK